MACSRGAGRRSLPAAHGSGKEVHWTCRTGWLCCTPKYAAIASSAAQARTECPSPQAVVSQEVLCNDARRTAPAARRVLYTRMPASSYRQYRALGLDITLVLTFQRFPWHFVVIVTTKTGYFALIQEKCATPATQVRTTRHFSVFQVIVATTGWASLPTFLYVVYRPSKSSRQPGVPLLSACPASFAASRRLGVHARSS